MNPRRSGTTRPVSTSTASVPASMRSSFVNTPIVRSPAPARQRQTERATTALVEVDFIVRNLAETDNGRAIVGLLANQKCSLAKQKKL
jgi:hypothetical protein